MDLLSLLTFAFLPGVGARSLVKLLGGRPPDLALMKAGLAAWQHAGHRSRAHALAAAELQRAQKVGVRILRLTDRDYPACLARIADPPPLLWVQGALAAGPALAIVGTRTPTPPGWAAATALAGAAAGSGWVVISGLARGIDAAAHRAALSGGGITWAVLGGGLARVYPPEHAALAAALVRQGGALISEHPLTTPVTAAGLVRRDRIQAGLAAAVAVCETGPAGGALHTARAALAARRPVLTPAPPAPGPGEAGYRLLLQLGARSYTDPHTALAALDCRQLED